MIANGIDDDYFSAIDRISRRSPQHPELSARIEAGKAVRLNTTNIAKESGHSRSTIYKRQNVLDRIEELEKGPRRGMQRKIEELNDVNNRLLEENKRVLNTAAAVIMRMKSLEQSHAKSTRRAEREAARPNPNAVVGEVVQLRPSGNKGD